MTPPTPLTDSDMQAHPAAVTQEVEIPPADEPVKVDDLTLGSIAAPEPASGFVADLDALRTTGAELARANGWSSVTIRGDGTVHVVREPMDLPDWLVVR